MTICLKPKSGLPSIVEVVGITPCQLGGIDVRQFGAAPVTFGNRVSKLGEHFDVSMTDDQKDDHIHWSGDLSNVNGIGIGMTSGSMSIDGNVGNYLGAKMSGGSLHLVGDARDLVGAEMSGGVITVEGNVGDFVGGSFEGQTMGQNGGTILINGNAGNDVGCEMKRGLIAISGDVGDRCGYRMGAGTLVVGGDTGRSVGMCMIRGTIILSRVLREVPIGFRRGGRSMPMVFRLVATHLAQLNMSMPSTDKQMQQFHGDVLTGSRGEIFAPVE